MTGNVQLIEIFKHEMNTGGASERDISCVAWKGLRRVSAGEHCFVVPE
jgi:hypothetical protein